MQQLAVSIHFYIQIRSFKKNLQKKCSVKLKKIYVYK